MRTLIFYVILFVGSLLTFNAQAFEVTYLSDATRFVTNNKDNYNKELVVSCMKSTTVGRLAILSRDDGLTEKTALEDLDNSIKTQEKIHGERLQQSTRLEFERMVRTVFRHPNMNEQEYNQQFFVECMYMRGY